MNINQVYDQIVSGYLMYIAKKNNVYCSYEGNGVYLIIHNGMQLRGYAKACLRYIRR